MKDGLTELVFILDRSGSMGGLESDTIGGFNSMIERQKKQDGEVNVTTVLFDDQCEIIHDRFPIDAIEPLTEDDYYVRGCTALLDAIGMSIQKLVNVEKHLPESHKAEKVIFVITTDGLENASKEFDYGKVKKLIEKQKQTGWEFMFLGANIDAVAEAKKFGIKADRAVTYNNDKKGVAMNYKVVSETVSAMRAAECMCDIGEEWKQEIEADYKRRGRKSR